MLVRGSEQASTRGKRICDADARRDYGPMSERIEADTEASVANRVFVLILQHPQERREPLATAPATVSTLRRAKLAVGLSWPNLPRALGRNADPRRWAVLYLGSAQPKELPRDREVVLLDRHGEPVEDPGSVLRGLEGIVLLDGTWSQAKTLWWRNPWLLKLHRLVLNPPLPARLGRLRREPRREALSTIEAGALVLRQLEADTVASDALLAALGRLIAEARRLKAPAGGP
jgi:DTW domain-containing protein